MQYILTAHPLYEDGTTGDALIDVSGADIHEVFTRAADELVQHPLDHAEDGALDMTLSKKEN